MRTFHYVRAGDAGEAVQSARGFRGAPTEAPAQFLAGGTTILDLMKLDAMRPETLIDVNDLRRDFGRISSGPDGLHLGAFVHMAEAAAHRDIVRDYPLIAQTLTLAASTQLRNMATLGGNVLQRTRCNYFRDTSWQHCNKRRPGSGCAALEGVNRKHAVLGTSDHCIATYPGDFAQALIAFDAEVELVGTEGLRRLRFADLHRLPAATPHIEANLRPGELITGFFVPAGPWTRRSLYLKIRDRASYEFALASAAVALDLDGEVVRHARIAFGGVATKPWRSHEAEDVLQGRTLDRAVAWDAAHNAFASAVTRGQNNFKPELGRRTLVRALMRAKVMDVPYG